MKLDFDDFKIITDEKQFIVQQKKIIQKSRLTKEENIGKVTYNDIAYCTNLNSALKFLSKKILLDNDDLQVILKKLNQLKDKINEFTKLLNESEDK